MLAKVLIVSLFNGMALAQHPAQDMAIHEKFYRDWMMPSNRSKSCCSDKDCAPAEAHRSSAGHWLARKVGPGHENDQFREILPPTEEHDRDSPDGRSHLCASPYNVYCFIAGSGA